MALRRHFGSRMLFHITIKSHLLLHYAIKGALLCPLLTSCWKGEDYVNIIKRILVSACNGTQPKILPNKAMRKYSAALDLSLSRLPSSLLESQAS